MNANRVGVKFALVLFLLGSGCSKKDDDPLKPFQGEWQFVEINSDGEIVNPKAVKVMSLKVEDSAFRLYAGKELGDDYSISVDNTKSPAEIDLTYVSGENKGKTELGIYAFEDERLRICVAGANGPRPTAFVVTPKTGVSLMILARK